MGGCFWQHIFSEKMYLKYLKKVSKTIIYSFFLPFPLLTTFTKCNGFTNNNKLKKTYIVQIQLTIVVQTSAHVCISFLVHINLKDKLYNCLCDIMDSNAIRQTRNKNSWL